MVMTGSIDFTGIALNLMSTLGYWGMTAGLVLDSFGIPIPSEVLLMVGGALAASGRFNPWVVFVLGTLAQVVGGLIGYLIGRYGGEPLLEKYGKYVLISHNDLQRTHRAFEKYGSWMTAIGRCVPFIRGLIAYPAGVAEMKLSRFLLYTTIGSAIWTALFVWLGIVLGSHLEVVEVWMEKLTVIILVLIVAWVIWHVREHLPTLKQKGGRRDS
jgi:membrane protein DedA with SNARE-associated domain